MKYYRIAWTLPLLFSVMLTLVVASAQAPYPTHLIPRGGEFSEHSTPFFNALSLRADQWGLNSIQILVFPGGIASNSGIISDAERNAQLTTADQWRQEIEANCQASMPLGVACTAELVPVITRADALAAPALRDLVSNPDAIVFLQNNAQRILEILQDTRLATDIISAYKAGTILNGPSNLFSARLIRGYRAGFTPASALTFGALLAGNAPEQGGLGVFPKQAILDHHPFSENRLGQLLNSITGPTGPQIGIGVEANTSFQIVEDREMLGFFGESVVAILDAETYHSANGIKYQPGTNLMSLRNVLLHLVAPGTTIYSLDQQESSLLPPAARLNREFGDLNTPRGAGAVLLTSHLLKDPSGVQSLIEFTNLSGGQNARLLILVAGYPESGEAEEDGAAITALLDVPSEVIVVQVGSEAPVRIDPSITGIILTGPDPAAIQLDDLAEVKSRWLTGTPVLGDRAGAAFLGLQHPDTLAPNMVLPSFAPGRFQLLAGLGLVQANIDPLALNTHSWERLITSSYLFPKTLSIGLAPGAALKIESDQASILGTNVVTVMDLRSASITTGSSGIYEIANGMLDVYTPGEQIQPLVADTEAAPIHAPTPKLTEPTAPPTRTAPATAVEAAAQSEPTEAPREKPPTKTPRPTGTPVATPPPSDPGTTNLMVFFGVLSVVVVIVGVWLNRQIAAE